MNDWTHLDASGAARMVDVGEKPVTRRLARASALIRMAPATLEAIGSGDLPKGDVLAAARLAGIMAAKRTGEWIPLCHPLSLDAVEVGLKPMPPDRLKVETCVRTTGRTGVEMEALVAASAAALTVYDMCKAIDRTMVVERLRLEEKAGGRSGHFVAGPVPEGDDR